MGWEIDMIIARVAPAKYDEKFQNWFMACAVKSHLVHGAENLACSWRQGSKVFKPRECHSRILI